VVFLKLWAKHSWSSNFLNYKPSVLKNL